MKLTRREKQVAELILAGNSQSDIAEELGISTSTTATYTGRIRAMLNVPLYAPLAEFTMVRLRRLLDDEDLKEEIKRDIAKSRQEESSSWYINSLRRV